MEQIIDLIAKFLDIPSSDIRADSNIRELAADSLDLVEIIILIEDQFQVDIADEDIDTLITLQDINDYIANASGQCGAI